MKAFSKKLFLGVLFAVMAIVIMPMAANAEKEATVEDGKVQKIEDTYYEFDENGVNTGKYTGFLHDDFGMMCIVDGEMQKTWYTAENGDVYYFGTVRNDNYYAMKGEVVLGDFALVYLFSEDGVLLRGAWYTQEGKGTKYYWAGKSVKSSFYDVDGLTYYFDEEGYMAQGIQKVSTEEDEKEIYWLFDEETGEALHQEEGFLTHNGKTYLYIDGGLHRGFTQYDGKYYYFSMNTFEMQTGEREVFAANSNGYFEEDRTFKFHEEEGWAMNLKGNPLTSLEEHTIHTWDHWIIDEEPTCKEYGSCHRECVECTISESGIMEKVDCSFSKEYTVLTKATMLTDGRKVKQCIWCGKNDESTLTIIPKASNLKISYTSTTYSGKTKNPTITIKDSKGNTISSSNYTLSKPSGRKNVGKYTYKITFKNEYSGTKSYTITIKPKTTSISKLTAASKAFTAKWYRKTTEVTSYQLQYSTDKDFESSVKTKTYTSNKTISKKITGLKAKKTYYVRVRTYKTVKIDGKNTKIYSSWSSAKKIKTK